MSRCKARPALCQAPVGMLGSGCFSNGDRELFRPIADVLLNHDPFTLPADYESCTEAQDRAEQAYRDPDHWTRMSILNAARCSFFSSDLTIR